jgi:hypothetical protein
LEQIGHFVLEWLYLIAYKKRHNILVGETEVDRKDGSILIIPSASFTTEDVELVREMTQQLEDLRSEGELPNLSDDLQLITGPDIQGTPGN